MNCSELIHGIDWALLRKQKAWLLRQAESCTEAHGLVALLDAVQDYAADEMFIDESLIFGE
jgi:hypothetical protein